ncbi:MAG: hypothetical protein H0T66_03890 [Geodermatophilaceae bacterium]|nr:hypothetical protein [Geodermatophilaceae bacterium]MDQ3454151.1 hypothetical protein [Actinomycetota bacterium]
MAVLRGRHRLPEVPALAALAAQRADRRVLLFGLDALGDDLQVQCLGHPHDRAHDLRLPGSRQRALDDLPVDLQEVQRDPLQGRQARRPGSEVVQTDLYPGVAQPLHPGHRRSTGIAQGALGQLDPQRAARQAGGGQRGGDPVGERAVRGAAVAQVDADEHARVELAERRLVGQGLPQHPGIDAADQAGVLGHREEVPCGQLDAALVPDP